MKQLKTCFLWVLFGVIATPLLAQFETADVLGTVRDASGAAISRASITLLNQATGSTQKSTTDDSGNFTFPNVKVGTYSVTAEATGFSKAVASDISVVVGSRQRVDISLQVGQVNDSIQVVDAASALETDSSAHGQVINSKQVVELPLNGRNYSDLALLSTNTVRSPISAAFAANATPREGAINVNGMRSTYNNFMMDGLDNNAYSPSNQGFSNQVAQPSPDAIAEFKVITSNFSAEYGRVGGGVVNAVLRSGSNEFHGTAYEFLRNTALNAAGWVFPSSTPFQKPTLQRNQFGFTIGGPIIKNKLFFFGDYEGFRQIQKYLNFDSIPTANDRNGILPNPVVNPLTGVVYPANTPIPVAQLNPFAAKVLRDLPATTGSGRSANFAAFLPVRDYADKYDAKLDYSINQKMSTFVRFSQHKDTTYQAPDIPGPSGGANNGYIRALQQQGAIGYTWTITPTSLFEARLGVNLIQAGKAPPYLGGGTMQDLYGIPGLPTASNIAGGLNSQSVSGFNAFGRQATNPQYQDPTSINPKFNYSKILGRHSLKTGYEFVNIWTEVLDINPLYGSATYAGQFSKPTCVQLGLATCTVASDATTYNLADFMFGLPSSIGFGNYFVTHQRQYVHSLYVQDDYRVNSKLTINAGLRYEFATPLWEENYNWTNFDPATNTLIKAKSGSLFDRALVHPDFKNFGPRLGLAYTVNPKTVVRAGYGISYSFFNRVGSALENINAPQAIFGVLNQSFPGGGPVPASFLTINKAYTAGIGDPSTYNATTQINSNVDYVDQNTRWPMVQNWLISVQREITKNWIVELAYNGNHSTRLPIIADYNQAFPNAPGATLGVQARRPIQSFGAITWVNPAGSNSYNGLSARVEHRVSNGLYFLNSFTWSKALGNSEQALEVYPGYTVANVQNIRNLAAERGPSSFDVKLNNVTSIVYELPFGKGRKFASNMNPVLEAALGGWQLNAIVTARTGTPVNVNYGPPAANDVTGAIADYRGLAVLRPNVSGTGIQQDKAAMVNNYFAGYTFTIPSASNPFGNLSRNAFRTPELAQGDIAVNKTFTLMERLRLQFRSEFFNITNKTNFGPPNHTVTSSAFGTIRNTFPARQVQFALKLIF